MVALAVAPPPHGVMLRLVTWRVVEFIIRSTIHPQRRSVAARACRRAGGRLLCNYSTTMSPEDRGVSFIRSSSYGQHQTTPCNPRTPSIINPDTEHYFGRAQGRALSAARRADNTRRPRQPCGAGRRPGAVVVDRLYQSIYGCMGGWGIWMYVVRDVRSCLNRRQHVLHSPMPCYVNQRL